MDIPGYKVEFCYTTFIIWSYQDDKRNLLYVYLFYQDSYFSGESTESSVLIRE